MASASSVGIAKPSITAPLAAAGSMSITSPSLRTTRVPGRHIGVGLDQALQGLTRHARLRRRDDRRATPRQLEGTDNTSPARG